MENNKTVEVHQSCDDVNRSISSRSSSNEFDRKSGVPETSIHGVTADTVSTANTAQSVHGGMGNTYNNYLFLSDRREEIITAIINKREIGTQIGNNVLKSTQDISVSKRKLRVRLDSESEKVIGVDYSPQHRQQAVVKGAPEVEAVVEVAIDATAEAVKESAKDATSEVAAGDATDATAGVATEAAVDATEEGATAYVSESGNDGDPPLIKASFVSALYRSMGILFRGRNTSQLKECLPGLEIREPDISLQSGGLSVGRCNEKSECNNTDECTEAGWVMVSKEDVVCPRSIVHNEVITQEVRVSQPTTTRQSQDLDIDNNDHVQMPFDTGGIYRNDGSGSSTSALGIQPESQEIRLGNQVKESTTPHENRHLKKGGDSNITRDAVSGGWAASEQRTEMVAMQHKHLLLQWKQIDRRDQPIVQELLKSTIYHAMNQSEGLRTLLPMLRKMSRDIAPGVPIHHDQIDDSYVGSLIIELIELGCDLSRKTATNVANYILTIGRNNPNLLLEIVKEMDRLDNTSCQ